MKDPYDPYDPYDGVDYTSPTFINLIEQDISVTPGGLYVASVYLAHAASSKTLYLRFGSASKPITVSSSAGRYDIITVASTGTLNFAIAKTSDDGYTSLALNIGQAKVQAGSEVTDYHGGGTYPQAYAVSSTGLVSFVTAPSTGAITWSGDYFSEADPIELATPYAVEDLPDVQFRQSNDVVIFTHSDYPPQWLGRYSETDWRWKNLACYGGPFEEINTIANSTVSVSAVFGTDADPNITITASKDIFTASDIGKLFKIEAQNTGTPWQAGKSYSGTSTVIYNGKYYTTTSTGTSGTTPPTHFEGTGSDGGLVWTYHDQGFGIARITEYTDSKHVRAIPLNAFNSTEASYRWAKGAWGRDVGYPGAVEWHQQRLFLAGTKAQPTTVWASRTSAYLDFSTSNPLVDDDALTFTVNSAQNKINGLISLRSLIAVTEGGIWAIGDETPLTPSNLSASLQGYRGASSLAPLGVGNAILYVQDKGQNVRDLTYEWASNSYNGNDLNEISPHLVDGYQIVDWCYQPSTSVIWAIRDDGTLLGCTYQREQQVIGWHRHETQGSFESICCIPEGQNDAVYVSVLRGTSRYIERFAQRRFDDVRDSWCLDAAIKYDGTNTTDTTITFTTSGGVYTATASANLFSTTDVGDQLVIFNESTRINYRWNIVARTNSTVVTVEPLRTPLASHLDTPIQNWAFARYAFSGADHLNGHICSVLADGWGDVNTVVINDIPEGNLSGKFSLPSPAYKVIIGLSYNCDISTMGINSYGEQMITRNRLVSGVNIMGDETWAFYVGRTTSTLFEMKSPQIQVYDDPVVVAQDVRPISITNAWDTKGEFVLRVSKPFPVSIQAIIPEVTIGG